MKALDDNYYRDYSNRYKIRIEDLTFDFAKNILFLSKDLTSVGREFVVSKQILRSGTSIAANVTEAEHPQSDADYLSKINIALKEANETEYWMELFFESEIIDRQMFDSLESDLNELISLLVASIKTAKGMNKK